MREASGDYGVVNDIGMLGKYQFSSLALQDAGFLDSSNNWTDVANQYGVYSKNDFLNNPAAQDCAVENYHKKVAGYIDYYGMDKYIGTQYCGVTVTRSGLLAACHLVGIGDFKKALFAGIMVWDGNGVPASEYMDIFAGYNIWKVWRSK